MYNLLKPDERFPLPVSEAQLLKKAVHRYPESLRNAPNWFVTESPDSTYFGRISAVTLAPLRCDRPEDLAYLKLAVQTWHDHRHWLDGVGFRVNFPWAVLVFQNCLTPGGNVNKRVRETISRIGGFWENTRNGSDIQGILWLSQRVQNRAGIIAGHAVYLCGDGVCGMTGRRIPDCGGDPTGTDEDAFSAIHHSMATMPSVDVLARPKSNTTTGRCHRKSIQLNLFDEL